MNNKELQRLEDTSDAARTIYHATALDDAAINEVYKTYKDAYMDVAYARFFNLDNQNN